MKKKYRRYKVGRTANKFHKNLNDVRGILGPIGSGKSVACCMEIARRAEAQKANSDGIRKTRWAIVRNTYGELKSTTIKTWQHWFPDSVCPIVYDSPIRGVLRYKMEDGAKVECEVYFISLDKPRDCAKVLSLELTGVWINEAREIDFSIVEACFSRTGRYPSKEEVELTWSGLIMDTNPPDNDHWWYKLAEEKTPSNYTFYHQPPAILYDKDKNEFRPNPEAENVGNLQLGYNYWLRMWTGSNLAFMKIYCMGEYGYVQEGKPVYPEYQDHIHCSQGEIPFNPGIPLILGFDFGLTPAAMFAQYYSGFHQLKFIDECVSKSMGLTQFLDISIIPKLKRDYNITDFSQIITIGDPAGNQRAQTNEVTCMDVLSGKGFNPEDGETNALLPRLEAMKGFMTRLTEGGAAFQVSPKCKTFRKGLQGRYNFERVQIGGEARYKDTPCKNIYSHCQDGAQYVAMKCKGGLEYDFGQQEVDDDIPECGIM